MALQLITATPAQGMTFTDEDVKRLAGFLALERAHLNGRRRRVRSALRTEGRFARHGRRSVAGINDGDLSQSSFRKLRSWL